MLRFLLLFAVLPTLGLRGETVLVLPFFNSSQRPDLDWIGESIADTLRESLASHGALVLDREDRLEGYRRLSLRTDARLTHASIIKLGQALDAAKLIYGEFKFTPAAVRVESAGSAPPSRGSLRIAARILDLRRLRQGPEFAMLGALEQLAELENRLGWQALKALLPRAAPSEQEFLQARPAIRLDAIESYSRGLLAALPEQKHRYFTQAARLDERYSQPCFHLGKIYWTNKDYATAARWLERVGRSDSHYLESQFFLGLCRYYTGDFKGAEASFQTVAAQVPLNEVFNNLGAAQARLSAAQAQANFQKALEGDSADPDYHFNLAYELWKAGQFEAAAARFRAALERDAQDSEAAVLLQRCMRRDGPKPGDPTAIGRERLKTEYEETAYRQLKAELESGR